MRPAVTVESEITEAEAARELAKIAAVVDTADRTAGPIDANELPVSPRLQAEGDIGATMGLEPARSESIRQARNALLLTLQLARATGHEAVHYSRNRNHYTRFKHNLPGYWTYLRVRKTVDTLISRPDIVREIRVLPQNPASPGFVRRRSTLFAGPKFVDAAVPAVSSDVEPMTAEQRVIRRDRRKKLLPILPSQTVDNTHDFLALFDAAIANTNFTFSDPDVMWLAPHLATLRHDGWQFLVNTHRRHFSRIFTGRMDAGGRYYRGFWQELPKALRAKLLIDGGTVGEYDYTACHLRLAHFAMRAAGDLDGGTGGDKYTLDGFGPEWRPQIKRAVQILLNARTMRGAVAAIAGDLPGDTWEVKIEVAWALANGIKRRHAAIEPLWHSGCGLGLQYVDSELTRLSVTELLSRCILPLPIHDSMVVRSEHLGDLVEVMDRRFEIDGRRLAVQRFKSLRRRGFYGKDLTQGRGSSPLPASPSRGTIDLLVPGSSVCVSDPRPAALPAKSVPVVGATIDFAPLSRLPVMVDLKSIVIHFNWISGGVIRSALLSAPPLYPDRASVVSAIRAWVAKLVVDNCATVDNERLEAEVARFMRRKPVPITPQSIARLCGLTSAVATSLGLSTITPSPRKATITRRAKRMGQTLPRIIDVKKAAAWGSTSRTCWYARHPSAAARQVAALAAILSSANSANILASREAIKRAKHERSHLSTSEAPADLLLKKLGALLLIHDLGLSPAAADTDDLVISHGDRLCFLRCKASPTSTERARAQTQELLASFVTLSVGTGIIRML
jgi:hypothetical protein